MDLSTEKQGVADPKKESRFRTILFYILLFILSPLGIPGLLFLGLLCWCVNLICITWNGLLELCFFWQMWRHGRTISLKQTKNHVAIHGGTLILEFPTIGWGISRAWWTPDNVALIGPCTPPDEKERRELKDFIFYGLHEWDRWCFNNYTSPDTGRAFLVRAWDGLYAERKIHRSLPNLNVVHNWTALSGIDNPEEWFEVVDEKEESPINEA